MGYPRASRSVKDLVREAKYYSSIAVDLSQYALATGSQAAALEVLQIEERIDSIVWELVEKAGLAVRSPDQAGLAVAIVELGRAFDRVSDAAGDLAGLVIRGYPVHEYIRGVVNCCGEVVRLVHASKNAEDVGANVDVLLVRRGETYILAPRNPRIREGDLLVVRGTPEEVAQAARNLEEPVNRTPLLRDQSFLSALAGDELAISLLRLRTLSRLMLEIAFHALIYVDRSLASIIPEMESLVDTVYLDVLEYSYTASIPSRAKEMVSIAIYADAMETISDAAVLIANIVLSPEYEEYSEILGEAVEEAEEGYARLLATEKLRGIPIQTLDLAHIGVEVLAVKRGSTWILPIPQDHELEDGEIVLIKYFKESDRDEEEILGLLENMGFRVLED